MKALENINVSTLEEAVQAAQQARSQGQSVFFSGGGTDLLQQIKDGTATADVIINLRNVEGADFIGQSGTGTVISGLISLDLLSEAVFVPGLDVLKQAAASVATPQIRHVATLAGNITQRPWCWYYRNGFNCYKSGGDQCFSVAGENQQHAIFGGGPSFIVHPSDLAPALVALNASFIATGPDGERTLSAEEFFLKPSQDPQRENALIQDELLGSISIPLLASNTVSVYHKIMDREAWTHAEVSVAAVLELRNNEVQRASIVLGGVATIPWRLIAVEEFLQGKQLNASTAQRAGELAIADAQPLSKNAHKLPMTSVAVERTVLSLATQ